MEQSRTGGVEMGVLPPVSIDDGDEKASRGDKVGELLLEMPVVMKFGPCRRSVVKERR